MKRRFGVLFPIVFLALMAQIIAPIASCWAESIMRADPLRAAELCIGAGKTSKNGSGSSGQHAMHDCCSACALAYAPAIPVDPQDHIAIPSQRIREIAWRHVDDVCARQQRDRNAQARAPPTLS